MNSFEGTYSMAQMNTKTLTTSTSTTITTTATCSPIYNFTTGLVAYFSMDSSPSYLTDVGGTPTATAVSVTSVSGERNQALSFVGTINSYFQINNLTSLGNSNVPFSIALYISPKVLSGTLVHISSHSNGMQACKEKVALMQH